MKTLAPIAAALIATAALSTSVYALDRQDPTGTAVEQNMNKLSRDGYKAMMDVREARLAIFNAKPDQAKTDIENAQKALAKAKTDNTAFMKSEAALNPPAGQKQNNAGTDTSADKTAADKTPVAWLPISGALGIDEDFRASPQKTAGVAKANSQLKQGQQKEAIETLRLSDVNMNFVMQVAPLDKTSQGVDQAAQLINSGKYYEANQALKTVEDGIRFDVIDVSATPKHASNQTPAATNQQAPAATTGTASATPPATDKK